MTHDEAERPEPPTLSWAIKYVLQDGHRHSFSDPAGARVWDGIFERVDAAEALTLATAARVDAEARVKMAQRIADSSHVRAVKRPANEPLGWRAGRARIRWFDAFASERSARSAECAALERWREVRGG